MDELGNEMDRALRVALTAAGQAAERRARKTEARLREAKQASEAAAREMHAQLQGEMSAARMIYRPTGDARWWASAETEDVAHAWGVATSWEAYDPQAKAATDLMRRGVEKKWPGAKVEDVFRLPQVWGGQIDPDARAAGEDLANALSDIERAQAERALVADIDAAADEKEQVDPAGADLDETRAEQLYDDAARELEVAELNASDAHTRGGEAPYRRVTAAEVDHLPSEQRQGRLDSAPGFGASTRGTLRSATATRAKPRASRGVATSKTRDKGVDR